MSKYDNYYKNAYVDFDYDEEIQLKSQLKDDEKVLWRGKPKKSARVWNSVFSSTLPFVLIWIAIDGLFIFSFLSSDGLYEMKLFVIGFFAIHLFPVWAYLWGIIKAIFKSNKDCYAITDKRILVKKDSVCFVSIYHTEILDVSVRRNIGDKIAGTGDLYININFKGREKILDVDNCEDAAFILQKQISELRESGYDPVNGGYIPPNTYVAQNIYANQNAAYSQGTRGMDVFAEGSQYYNTQYVVNGQFVNGPNQGNNAAGTYMNSPQMNNVQMNNVQMNNNQMNNNQMNQPVEKMYKDYFDSMKKG